MSKSNEPFDSFGATPSRKDSDDGGDKKFSYVCRVDEVKDGCMVQRSVKDVRVCIVKAKNSFYAINDACPHQGASLAMGDIEDGFVVCPRHGWKFRYDTGESDIPDLCTQVYPLRVEGNELSVNVEEEERENE